MTDKSPWQEESTTPLLLEDVQDVAAATFRLSKTRKKKQPSVPTLVYILVPIAILLPLLFALALFLPPAPPHGDENVGGGPSSSPARNDEDLTTTTPRFQTPSTRFEIASSSDDDGGRTTTPVQIHLGLSSSPTTYHIQFATMSPGHAVVEIALKDRTTKEHSWTLHSGKSITYGPSDMCQPPANEGGQDKFSVRGYYHVVSVELEGGKGYVYRCGLGTGLGVRWSEYHEFETTEQPGRDADSIEGRPVVTFLALGDQGCREETYSDAPASAAKSVAALIASIVSESFVSSVHHLGDLSYADGASRLWDEYLALISPYASRVPVTVGVGNHEYDHTQGGEGKDPSGEEAGGGGFRPHWGNYGEDSGGECGVPVSRRFSGPENGNGVYWYSFDHPLVHIIMLSTEHNMAADSPQYQWLKRDLESVNRTLTPWLVVEMHRPMYDKYQKDDAVAVAIQYEIEDLLYEYNVDLVLSAHFHAYLRTCDGLFRGKCDNGGPMHITVGTGGAPLDGGTHAASSPWIEKYDGTHWGVGKASVLDASTLHWEFVVVGGDVEDEVTISRSR